MIGVIGVSLAGVFWPPMLKPSAPSSFFQYWCFPELLDQFGLVLQYIERRDARGRHRRRMRRREQERTSAMIEEIDQVVRAADVSAKRADRLRKRADLNINTSVHTEVIDRAAAVPSKDAR